MPKNLRDVKFTQTDWAQAGKSLFWCSGLACLVLALSSSPESQLQRGAGFLLLRVWVGGFGLLIAGVTVWRTLKAPRIPDK